MVVGGTITKVGLDLVASRLFNATKTPITQFKVGTGTTTATTSDTDLEASVLTKDVSLVTFNTTTHTATVKCYLTAGDANGNLLTEAGEFNTDSSPVMFDHDIFTGISKTDSDEIIINYVHEIQIV